MPFQRVSNSSETPNVHRQAQGPASSSQITINGTVEQRLGDGRVAPLSGVSLVASTGGRAVTDRNGTFTLSLVRNKEQEIRVSKSGYVFDTPNFWLHPRYDNESDVSLVASKAEVRAEVSTTEEMVGPVYRKMGEIRGQFVFDQSVANDPFYTSANRILIRDPNTKAVMRSTPTRFDGSFSIAGPVGKTYILEVEAKEGAVYSPSRGTVVISADPKPFTINVRKK
ncbi:MAG: carboxypeptidase-like regulatory domain-containing protein [Chthoniobacterales bacterium]